MCVCAFFRKAITTLAFSPDGKYIVTGEVSGVFLRFARRVGVVCLVGVSQPCGVMSVISCHQGGLADLLFSRVAERPHAGGASVGRVRAPPGGRAAGAQVRCGLRDLLAQREVRGERGLPA